MSSSEDGIVPVLEERIESVRNEVAGIRKDVKDLVRAFRDLVRVDTDMKAIRTDLVRMREEQGDLVQRLRSLEEFRQSHAATDAVRWGISQWVVVGIIGAVISVATGITVGLSIWVLTT